MILISSVILDLFDLTPTFHGKQEEMEQLQLKLGKDLELRKKLVLQKREKLFVFKKEKNLKTRITL